MSQLGKMWEVFFLGFFGVAALSIIYVSAGRRGGQNGGQQTGTIIQSTGQALSSTANALEQNG